MGSISESDMTAVAWAVRILNEAGYSVEQAGKAKSSDNGVSFRLDCEAPTRAASFQARAEAAKTAVMETPEVDFHGNLQEDDDESV